MMNMDGVKAGGVCAHLENFDVYFGMKVSHLVFFCHRGVFLFDITLQDALLQSEVAMRFLDRNQSDEAYDHFYQLVVDKSSGLTNPPCLPRARRPPKRYDSGTTCIHNTQRLFSTHLF